MTDKPKLSDAATTMKAARAELSVRIYHLLEDARDILLLAHPEAVALGTQEGDAVMTLIQAINGVEEDVRPDNRGAAYDRAGFYSGKIVYRELIESGEWFEVRPQDVAYGEAADGSVVRVVRRVAAPGQVQLDEDALPDEERFYQIHCQRIDARMKGK